VALVGADGRFLRVNAALCVMLGRPADKLTRLRWQDVLAPADVRAIAGEGGEAAVRAPRPDGTEVHVRITARALPGEGQLVAHVEDRTHRPAREAALEAVAARRRAEADRARLGALAEAAPDAIVIKDVDGTITSWNPGAEQMFGLAADEAVGRSYEEAVVPDGERATWRRIRRDLGYGRSRTVRMDAMRADGSTFPAQVSAAALADGAGTVAIIRDISDLVAAQRELERSNADLERFAYAASHDLQEPLRTIRMGAETVMLAASERLDEDERGLLAHVEQAAGRMSSQVQALMDVARVALDDVSEHEATSLQQALEDACAALRAAMRDADAQVEVDGPLPLAGVPRAEMALVLQNLLSNAIKFGRPGERPCVVLRAREAGGVVELRVSDNGIGLTEAAAAKIFGLFERGRTGVPGTGVGLAVCRQILERRGGSISVSSGGPGQGAAFTLRLPPARTSS
jgi:PAS domain S-box-containing protein